MANSPTKPSGRPDIMNNPIDLCRCEHTAGDHDATTQACRKCAHPSHVSKLGTPCTTLRPK